MQKYSRLLSAAVVISTLRVKMVYDKFSAAASQALNYINKSCRLSEISGLL